MTKIENLTPRVQIVWQVLEAAKDNNDQMVIAACRRLIWANTLGWRKHAKPEDWQMILEFALWKAAHAKEVSWARNQLKHSPMAQLSNVIQFTATSSANKVELSILLKAYG